ncbi:MAG: hypothetical protein HY459_02125 [Parcubacteria group bacterium]|nr:hypothetical protein [Parcubacteria group bacterium]
MPTELSETIGGNKGVSLLPPPYPKDTQDRNDNKEGQYSNLVHDRSGKVLKHIRVKERERNTVIVRFAGSLLDKGGNTTASMIFVMPAHPHKPKDRYPKEARKKKNRGYAFHI